MPPVAPSLPSPSTDDTVTAQLPVQDAPAVTAQLPVQDAPTSQIGSLTPGMVNSTGEHVARERFPRSFEGRSPDEVETLERAYDLFASYVDQARALQPDASDIQFVGGDVIWIHSNAAEHRTTIRIDNDEHLLAWARLFGPDGDGDDRLANGPKGALENAIDIAGVRLRMTFRRQHGGYALNVRILEQTPPTLTHSRFANNPVPQELIDVILKNTDGLVLFEGPTGSGKSFMQAALIAEVNRTQHRHIYTLEDPIEFLHVSQKSLLTQRQIGSDVESFEQGLITAKRSKPGIILLGELRDRDVMRAAVNAAGEGHLVMATSHASNVPSAIASFVGSFGADEQAEIRQRLASSLRAVVVQKLVPSTNGKVVAVRELLMVTNQIQAKIRSESSSEEIKAAMYSSATKGSGTFAMDDDLVRLTEAGMVQPVTAIEKSDQKTQVMDRLQRAGLWNVRDGKPTELFQARMNEFLTRG